MLKRFAGIGLILLLAGFAPLLRNVAGRGGAAPDRPPQALRSPQTSETGQGLPASRGRRTQADTQDLNETLTALSGLSKQQLARQQQARLEADMDKLAVLQSYDPGLAKALYGDDWQAKVEAHRREGERAEFLFTLSIVLTALGGLLFGGCVTLGVTRGLVRMGRHLAQRLSSRDSEEEVTPADQESPSTESPPLDSEEEAEPPDPGEAKGRSVAVLPCGPRFFANVEKEESLPYRRIVNPMQDHCLGNMIDSVHSGLLPREEGSSRTDIAQDESATRGPILLERDEQETERSSQWEASLRSHAAAVEKQMAEVKEVTEQVREITSEGSEPVNQALLSLNDQISAIRTFASDQQERVEKLQKGYDWNIIRTFCLRIIRCIDNIESRMRSASGVLEEKHPFAEIRDELLFALESSGVEQFEPKVKSPFSGQERCAEAIKERQVTKNQSLKGCIAKIIKPGYQYILDEETQRVVRTARVKLYAG